MSAIRSIFRKLAEEYDPEEDKRTTHSTKLYAFRLRNPRPSPADKYRIWASVYRPLPPPYPDANYQDMLRQYESAVTREAAIMFRNKLERYIESAAREDAEYESIAVPVTEQFEKRYYRKKRVERARVMRKRVTQSIERKTYKSRVATQPQKLPHWGRTPDPQIMYRKDWNLIPFDAY